MWVHVRSSAPVEKGIDDAQEPLLPSSPVSSPRQVKSAGSSRNTVCCNHPDVPGCTAG